MTGLWFNGRFAPEIVENGGLLAVTACRQVQVGEEDLGRHRSLARPVERLFAGGRNEAAAARGGTQEGSQRGQWIPHFGDLKEDRG